MKQYSNEAVALQRFGKLQTLYQEKQKLTPPWQIKRARGVT